MGAMGVNAQALIHYSIQPYTLYNQSVCTREWMSRYTGTVVLKGTFMDYFTHNTLLTEHAVIITQLLCSVNSEKPGSCFYAISCGV